MSAYSDLILAEPALQSYWRLGEAFGSGTVADSKGAITGTVAAATTLGAPGLLTGDLDTCVLINPAANNNIQMGDVYPFTGTASFSVEAWVKPDAAALTNSGHIVFNLDAAGVDGWRLRFISGGIARFNRVVTSVQNSCSSGAGTIVADTTYHIVGTYDGTDMRLYIDAVEAAILEDLRSLNNPTNAFTIGAVSTGGTRGTGNIDEVAIYNDDLSAASVLEHYEIGIESGPTLLASDDPPFGFSGRGAGW